MTQVLSVKSTGYKGYWFGIIGAMVEAGGSPMTQEFCDTQTDIQKRIEYARVYRKHARCLRNLGREIEARADYGMAQYQIQVARRMRLGTW